MTLLSSPSVAWSQVHGSSRRGRRRPGTPGDRKQAWYTSIPATLSSATDHVTPDRAAVPGVVQRLSHVLSAEVDHCGEGVGARQQPGQEAEDNQ